MPEDNQTELAATKRREEDFLSFRKQVIYVDEINNQRMTIGLAFRYAGTAFIGLILVNCLLGAILGLGMGMESIDPAMGIASIVSPFFTGGIMFFMLSELQCNFLLRNEFQPLRRRRSFLIGRVLFFWSLPNMLIVGYAMKYLALTAVHSGSFTELITEYDDTLFAICATAVLSVISFSLLLIRDQSYRKEVIQNLDKWKRSKIP